MTCCFCGKELADMGNSPYPFLKKKNLAGIEYNCCNKCNKLFVIPARQLVKYQINDDDWDKVLCWIKIALMELK